MHTKPMECTTCFANHKLVLDPEGVIYWPAESLLLVSDLHLEKARSFHSHAHPLPVYDTHDTLIRLQKLIEDYQPQAVICLGDSFHSTHMLATLEAKTIEAINHLCQSVPRWCWLLGNHDPVLPESILGERCQSLIIAGITLCHEPTDDNKPQIFGHFHPKATLRIKAQKIIGRCFLINYNRLMMPAFGTFTGGLNIDDPAIKEHLPKATRTAYVIYHQKLWRFS